MEASEANRIQEAQKLEDPLDPNADPDPQHWYRGTIFLFILFVKYFSP